MYMFRDTPSWGKQVLALVGFLIATYVTAAIGAFGSLNAQQFYAELNLPAFAPPAWVFGPVWTVLYGMMAVAAFLVWRRAGWRYASSALILFWIQLFLNGLWSWVFFAWYQGFWAFVEILLLWIAIVATTIAFWQHSKRAALLMIPYLAWVTFAAVLTFSLWRLNPSIL